MQGGGLRVMGRYPLVTLVDQGRLTQREAAAEMGLSVRQMRRVLKRYRESGGRLESLGYQRRSPPRARQERSAPMVQGAPLRFVLRLLPCLT